MNAIAVVGAQALPEPSELGLFGRPGARAENALPVIAHQVLDKRVAVGGHARPFDQVGHGLVEQHPGLGQLQDAGALFGHELRRTLGSVRGADLVDVVGDIEPFVARERVRERVERRVAGGALGRADALAVVVDGLSGHGRQALQQRQVEAEVSPIGLRRRRAGHGREHRKGRQKPAVREHAGPVIAVDQLPDVVAAREHVADEIAVEGSVRGRRAGDAGDEVGAHQQIARVVVVDLAVHEEGVVVVVVGQRHRPRARAALDATVGPDLAVGQAPQRAVLAAPRLALHAPVEGRVRLGPRVGGAREGFVLLEGGRATAEVEVHLAEHVAGIIPAGAPALDFEGRVAALGGPTRRVAGARADLDLGAVRDAVPVGVELCDGLERRG